MSSYSYRISFNDGGKVVLQEALNSLISICEKNQSNGKLVPYTAYQILAENMLDQISRNKFSLESELLEEGEEAFGIFKEIEI